MPDWNSPAELAVDAAAFLKFIHAMAGLYFWEWVTTLDYEWAFITRQKRFHYPAVFYFLNRYSLLFTMIGLLIAEDSTSEINCQALYTFNQITGQAASGLASINLSIRTIALWQNDKRVVIPIVIIILGHWSLILQGVTVTATWQDGVGCVVGGVNNTILAATFIYSMCFDLVILSVSMYKLVVSARTGRSQLMSLLFQDGLMYFFIAFLSNMLAVVFILLNLNAILSVIFNIPAAIFSTIVACRAVRRLNNFATKGPEIFSSTGHSFRAAPTAGNVVAPTKSDLHHGVHVQMQTFTVADDHVSDTDVHELERKGRGVPDVEAGDGSPSVEYKVPYGASAL
ncbi:uncharacterized protein BXZ73DRAFT_45839 [Epithele typhae]|uniref:uncharacterized protein n=1 Tax=Epithele typhae TaxID=378194 RepID=UPI00200811CB|nr:uncharacterized protein BXZ73DRAFT_45839 [Epithele typhae]KAH9934540.1 hypothetical protein BXZ73DRAFT_45839 [Epithele typhae]